MWAAFRILKQVELLGPESEAGQWLKGVLRNIVGGKGLSRTRFETRAHPLTLPLYPDCKDEAGREDIVEAFVNLTQTYLRENEVDDSVRQWIQNFTGEFIAFINSTAEGSNFLFYSSLGVNEVSYLTELLDWMLGRTGNSPDGNSGDGPELPQTSENPTDEHDAKSEGHQHGFGDSAEIMQSPENEDEQREED